MPFCPVCKNAGKTEEEYTSHFVRESREADAKVTCPVLLSQACDICGECGHTKKYCEKKKFCPICKSAGKSFAEYSSHFVRASPDPDSEVVCPTLLNMCCEYCSEYGHTVKYCPNYDSDDETFDTETYTKYIEMKKEAKKTTTNTTTITTTNTHTEQPKSYSTILQEKQNQRLFPLLNYKEINDYLMKRDGYVWIDLIE
jgi:hypothetical protein